MEVAVGVEPAIGLSSVAKVPYGVCELDVAGGLRGEPVEVVRAETVDLLVPARAEIVIEGYVDPLERMEEGPFGEFTGYMAHKGQRNVFTVTCITHRERPLYHAYTSQIPPSESSMIRGQAFSSILWKELVWDLKEPGIRDLVLTESSGYQSHVVVSMTPFYPGHAQKVGLILANLRPNVGKFVTVVDADIDIRDPFAVDWALNYRVNPERDIYIIPNSAASPLDPSTTIDITELSDKPKGARRSSKVVIDATIKFETPEIALAPLEYFEQVFATWEEIGLPPIELPRRVKLLLENHSPATADNLIRPYSSSKPL